jgi:hypothetical protein
MSQSINPYDPPTSGPSHGNLDSTVRQFGDEPIATFRLMLTDSWHDQAFQLVWRTKTTLWIISFWIIVAVIPVLGLALNRFARNNFALLDDVSVFFAIVAISIAIFSFWKWTSWRQSRAELSNLADYNGPATFVVYREGLVAAGFNATSITQWNAFSHAIAFREGVVLVVRPNMFWLLSASDMMDGNLEDVHQLLRQSGLRQRVVV